ncbi:MAG: HNH endonuclease signature motif containing protein [Gemmatimonadetes bacterium]|nr:HNH endonuclease signature motif containing protein [Gemmatimonadota bacterium]
MNVDEVWKKGKIVPNNNPDVYRKDVCGAFIRRDQYGTQAEYGWEIDHIKPVSKGGSDYIGNLRPLHWRNNDAKGDNLDGYWNCAKTS